MRDWMPSVLPAIMPADSPEEGPVAVSPSHLGSNHMVEQHAPGSTRVVGYARVDSPAGRMHLHRRSHPAKQPTRPWTEHRKRYAGHVLQRDAGSEPTHPSQTTYHPRRAHMHLASHLVFNLGCQLIQELHGLRSLLRLPQHE